MGKKNRKLSKSDKVKRVDIKIGDHSIKDIKWEDLATDANSLAKSLSYQIALAQKIGEENKQTIEDNRRLALRFNGYSKSLVDLAEKFATVRSRHMEEGDTSWRSINKGIITDDNDIMFYFNIKNLYASYMETLGNLTTVFFTDFLTDIKSANVSKEVDNIIKGISNSGFQDTANAKEKLDKGESYESKSNIQL